MNKLFSALIVSVTLVFALGAQTASAATVQRTFTNTIDATIVRYNDHLFSFNEVGGQLKVYRRNNGNHGKPVGWVNVTQDVPQAAMANSLTSVDAQINFGNRVFVAGHGSNGVEIWKKCLHCGKAWNQSGTDGLGDAANESVTALFKVGVRLYAFVFNSDDRASRLYSTQDGTNWAQVGSTGLDNNLTVISAGVTPDGQHVIVGASDENPSIHGDLIYRASVSDLTTWNFITNAEDLPGSNMSTGLPWVQNIQDGYVVVHDVDPFTTLPVEVYRTEDGETYTLVGAAGLGGSERDLGFIGVVNGTLYATGTQDQPSIYQYDSTSNAWTTTFASSVSTGRDQSTFTDYPITNVVYYGGYYYFTLYSDSNTHLRIFKI